MFTVPQFLKGGNTPSLDRAAMGLGSSVAFCFQLPSGAPLLVIVEGIGFQLPRDAQPSRSPAVKISNEVRSCQRHSIPQKEETIQRQEAELSNNS